MNALPKIRTQEDVQREQVESWKNGTDRDRALIILSAFSPSNRTLPSTDDHGKIAREAVKDFSSSNFSEARSAVESLAIIADFYKELAEKYLAALTSLGAITDEYGDIKRDPFVLVDAAGNQRLGVVEVISHEEPEEIIWNYYIKPYLALATDVEKQWIADNYTEFVEVSS